jgi:hypothetical protein
LIGPRRAPLLHRTSGEVAGLGSAERRQGCPLHAFVADARIVIADPGLPKPHAAAQDQPRPGSGPGSGPASPHFSFTGFAAAASDWAEMRRDGNLPRRCPPPAAGAADVPLPVARHAGGRIRDAGPHRLGTAESGTDLRPGPQVYSPKDAIRHLRRCSPSATPWAFSPTMPRIWRGTRAGRPRHCQLWQAYLPNIADEVSQIVLKILRTRRMDHRCLAQR